MKRFIPCAAAGLAAALALAAPAGADWTAGAPSSGEPFFPQMGNGGYDVRHYSLDLDYDPRTQVLEGSTEITLVATQDLDQFNLDLRDWVGVSRVTVDGVRAGYFQEDGQELVVTPHPKMRAGRTYTVDVDYRGVPETVVDPDHSFEGWVKNADGAFVVNEPQGSPGWFPCNDDPNDKATYDFRISVPAGNVALGNGLLVSSVTRGRKTTWRWREDSPMSTYLTTATNGDFDLEIDTGPNGLPIYNAVDSKGDSATTDGFSAANKATIAQRLALQPQIISVLTELWGPYPFTSAGAVVDRGHVGYALESQTKPMYDGVPQLSTVVHELAHQWFGDSVTLSVWRDIWLNEGFARFSEWMYNERTGGATAQAQFNSSANYGLRADHPNWQIPTASIPGPENLFSPSFVSYNRGAMTLQALRVKIGDAVFFPMMRAWYAENRDGNVTTEDFIALAERESGQQLDAFFDVWLYTPGKPTSW